MTSSALATRATSSPVALELRDVERTHPRETIRRASRMVSSRVGIIRFLGHGRTYAQDPATFSMGIVASDLSRYSETTNASKGGGGGEAMEAALAATLGEAAERYCMFFYDKNEMLHAPYREVAADALSPEDLRLYSREQVEALGPGARVVYFDDSTPVRWVQGWSITERRPRLVPASLVYMNYQFGDDEGVIGRNASSGLAAGMTIEEAILTGLQEVIERDAFTICWLCRRPGRRVGLDDDDLQELVRGRFQGHHPSVRITAYDVSPDLPIASCWIVLSRPSEFGPAICVGSASRLDPRAAIRKCLLEAGQGLPYFRFLLEQLEDWQPADDFLDVTSFDHHCVFYLKRPDLIPEAFAFLDAPDDEVALSAMPDRSTGRVLGDLERIVEMLREVGLEVVVVDITTPDVAEVGLRVVRVLVPGMVPLHGVHKFPFLGSRRLADFPPRTGPWPVDGRQRSSFNPYPHPFP